MKVVEARLIEAQEREQQVSEEITTLPLVECMETILDKR
jgi:hypothetical protein